MSGEVQQLAQALIPVIQAGFVFGIFLAVIIGAGKIGFKLAPWIIGIAAILYFFGG